jgi:hypothetical protein
MMQLKKAFTHALYFLVIIAVISSSGKSFAAAQTEMPQTSLHHDVEWKQYLQERQKRCITNLPVPQGIEVLGTTAINKKTIEKCLQPYIGKPVNGARLEKDLTALMGSGLYQNLSYQFVRYNGEPVDIKMRMSKWGVL